VQCASIGRSSQSQRVSPSEKRSFPSRSSPRCLASIRKFARVASLRDVTPRARAASLRTLPAGRSSALFEAAHRTSRWGGCGQACGEAGGSAGWETPCPKDRAEEFSMPRLAVPSFSTLACPRPLHPEDDPVEITLSVLTCPAPRVRLTRAPRFLARQGLCRRAARAAWPSGGASHARDAEGCGVDLGRIVRDSGR